MCNRFRIILNILTVFHVRITLGVDSQFDALQTQRIIDKQSQGIMSPKMDYDEWTPLGRGDPLKNDPTFDYSPPMVSKVKYWINPLFRTPDPPIIPSKEATTETSQYTATTAATSTTLSKSSSLSKPLSPAEIKRFYIDLKDPSDMTYVQLMNSKYNNKLVRPQQHVSYPNHYYTHMRQQQPQPPQPLPMLVPPPPVEPSSYSSSKIENSTILELSWDMNKSHLSSIATINNLMSTTPIFDYSLLAKTTTTMMPSSPATKIERKPEVAKTTSDKSILQNLLVKEKSEAQVTNPTTFAPLTPHPVPFSIKQNTRPMKPPTYLIIQGHSKVKKYGGTPKSERSDILSQDTNDINDMKFELPKDVREGRQLNVDDFLPLNGMLKESLTNFITSQSEGSGFGAELTKAIFPAYIRPSTTLQYDSPRMYEYNDEDIEESYS